MNALLCLVLLASFGRSQATRPHNSYDRYVCPDASSFDIYHDKDIVRPCPWHDLNCIRGFFSHYYGCTPVSGAGPDPYIVKTVVPLEIPHTNASATFNYLQLKGLDSGTIREFYINKKTDTLVLEVEFNGLVAYCPTTVLTYHRKGKETLETCDFTRAEYSKLSLTLTIRPYKFMKVAERHVFTYFGEIPSVTLGPGFLNTSSPELSIVVNNVVVNLDSTSKEAAVMYGKAYMDAFLETNVCSFENHKEKS